MTDRLSPLPLINRSEVMASTFDVEESTDSEDDLPLSCRLKAKAVAEDELPLSVVRSSLKTKHPDLEFQESMNCNTTAKGPERTEMIDHELNYVSQIHDVSKCAHDHCFGEVFSTCSSCLSYLCCEHFISDSLCSMHGINNQSLNPSLEADSSLLTSYEVELFNDTIVATQQPKQAEICVFSEDDLPLSCLKAKAISEDDLPLSVVRSSLKTKHPAVEAEESMPSKDSKRTEKVYQELTNVSQTHEISKCTHDQCCGEVFSTCCSCLSFLCYDHFISDSPCSMHRTSSQILASFLEVDSSLLTPCELEQLEYDDEASILDDTTRDPDFVPNHEEDAEESDESEHNTRHDSGKGILCPSDSKGMDNGENKKRIIKSSKDPTSFLVDGEPRETISESGTPKKRKQPEDVRGARKKARNQGREYTTATGKKVSKKIVGHRCQSSRCAVRNLSCHELTESDRREIYEGFFRSGQLNDQRKFLASYIDELEAKNKKKGSRKERKMIYHLPINKERKQVCQKMFLSTLGVTGRQIRTTLSKRKKDGQMEMEGRGGRRDSDKLNDERKRQSIFNHIEKFPRMESHYCRVKSKHEFLSPELNIPTMYDMYVADMKAKNEKPASQVTYYRVFKSMGLKFFSLKKDACGICLRKMKENPQDESFVATYQKHINEKLQVRQVKEEMKEMAKQDPKLCAAVFDLQQVIYTPKSNHSSIFYKRRLANYNFTIYDLHSGEGRCFLWHEGVAKRGANEISTCIYKFLQEMDADGKEQVTLFCDGCVGQNKNSVLHSMIFYTLQKATNLKKVSVNYFETNHGQSEGDCMHSVIERKVKRQPEIMVPSQLATIVQMARASGKKQYKVYQINTADILDWKQYGQDIGFQKWRGTNDGNNLVWTKVMAVSIEKKEEECHVFFKHSHLDPSFSQLNKPPMRSSKKSEKTKNTPKRAYSSSPKLTFEKYKDLIGLCSGPKPVVYQQDQVQFYMNLPHVQN